MNFYKFEAGKDERLTYFPTEPGKIATRERASHTAPVHYGNVNGIERMIGDDKIPLRCFAIHIND